MSSNICPVIRLGAPRPIPGADKIEVFEVFGSGPCIAVKGQFREGDLACFIPPESMVDTFHHAFDFLKKHARKSDGWAKVKPIRLRGQVSVGLLMDVRNKHGDWVDVCREGDNMADFFKVKKPEDFKPKPHVPKTAPWYKRAWWRLTGTGPYKIVNAPYPGIPTYDIAQFYKLPKDLFSREGDPLMVVTEKLHGTNARYCIGKDGKFRVGTRMRWLDDSKPFTGFYKENVWVKAAIDADLEKKLRRLAEPLVLWGEVVGPGIQKGFDYGCDKPTFFAFDFYHCGERRFLSQSECYNLCRWLEIKHVPQLHIDNWSKIQYRLGDMAKQVDRGSHPQEGIVVRPYVTDGIATDLAGQGMRLAGKVINPAYLEFTKDEDPADDQPVDPV